MIIYDYCLSVNFWDSQLNSRPIIQNKLSEMLTGNNAVRQC